jgi:hypothetical protein
MDFTEAQNQIVRTVAAAADVGPWERLFTDVEILEHPGDYQIDYVGLAVVRTGGDLEVRQFDLSDAARQAIVALYRQRKDEADETIGGFTLAIDPPGRFRFDFLNEPPKRINGIWDEAQAARLNNYLETYRAELAQAR